VSGPDKTSARADIDPALRRLATVVILGAIMSILDTTIVNVAIDTLSRDFRSPLSTIQWVLTGYLLALATVIPLTGWAMERFGAKRMWILSLVLFLGGSVLSGAAWSASALIVFRILQGLGGGMIMPIGQAIMARAAGPERMGRVMSVLGVPMLLGPVLGPVIGGFIVDSFSWRWIFYVNLPIGIVAIAAAVRMLPRDHGPTHPVHLDAVSLVLLSPGLAAIVYGLSQAGQGSTLSVAAPLAIGAGLVGAFALHALRTSRTPLIDVRLFYDRSFASSAATTFLFGAALFGAMLLLPLYYQVVRGDSALSAGLLMAPQGIGAALVMPLAGRLTDRLGAGRIVPVGLVVAVLGTVAYTQVGPATNYAWLAFSLLIRGIGFGFVMMPAMAAAYQTLTVGQVARATTAINIVQRVGGSVGTAVLAVVLEHQISTQFHAASSLSSVATIPPRILHQVAPKLSVAFGNTFWWAVGMTVAALLPAIVLPRHPATGRGAGSGSGPGGGPGARAPAVPLGE
jgi:EmrB/QacA subfamily drug resistance transporter